MTFLFCDKINQNINDMRKPVFILIFACVAVFAQAQLLPNESFTESPRGVYRLTTIIGKSGEVIAPYEQYKICTDSVTLHCSVEDYKFAITQNDKQVFNYTGENPLSPMEKKMLIYNSNSLQFSLKWWSTYPKHQIVPNKGWCIENYQSGIYSDYARPFFNAIMQPVKKDKKNPFIGKWRLVGMMDELQELKDMYKFPAQEAASMIVFTPSYIVMVNHNNGRGWVFHAAYNGKESVSFNKEVRKATWLTPDCIALPFTIDYRTDYEIWQREDDEISIISHIADRFVENR